MARKQGTSVRNFDVVKPRSTKFEPSRIQTHFKTIQNLAHLQKTETTRTICTRSKTLENKPVTQKTKAILAKTRETEPIAEYRRITRFRFAETQRNASQNQAMDRKIADEPSKSIPLPKKKDQVPSSIRSSFQKLAKSEDARKVGVIKFKAHAVAVETLKQTAGVVPCSVMEPSSKSESHTVAGCSTSVLHRRLCYDAARRERIQKANVKKNQSKPEGPCSTPVKQMIPHSDAICSAAPRKGKSKNDLDVYRVSSSVCKKLVLDEDVLKELEYVLDDMKYPPALKSIMKVSFGKDLKDASPAFKNIKKVRFAQDLETNAQPMKKEENKWFVL